ncbi:hypothetical protein D3C72_2206700 [compost metagenome]
MFWMAAGVSTWLQKIEKFFRSFWMAKRSASAVGGVVVSKPMAKKTTSRSGSASAILSASSVE